MAKSNYWGKNNYFAIDTSAASEQITAARLEAAAQQPHFVQQAAAAVRRAEHEHQVRIVEYQRGKTDFGPVKAAAADLEAARDWLRQAREMWQAGETDDLDAERPDDARQPSASFTARNATSEARLLAELETIPY